MVRLSDRVQSIPLALSIYMNQLVYDRKRAGLPVTTLSLGEAFFDIPPLDFSSIPAEKAFHYADSKGIPELRKRICTYYHRQYGVTVDSDRELLISAGSKAIIFMAMQALLNRGDLVMIQEPAWLSYQEQVKLVDAVPYFVPFDYPLHKLENALRSGTRLLVLNNPNNPAGRLYSEAELRTIYRMCRAHDIVLLVDEAYSDFVLDETFYSAAKLDIDKQNLVVVNSLSKNFGMSGWRIGYAIANRYVIEALAKLNQHIITCAPSVLMYYLAEHFDAILSVTLPQVEAMVRKRRRIAEVLKQLELDALEGGSTFYFFVSIAPFAGSAMDFALALLLDDGIAVVPGSAYGVSTERFVRVSIGTESENKIIRALTILRDRLQARPVSREYLASRLKQVGVQRFDLPTGGYEVMEAAP